MTLSVMKLFGARQPRGITHNIKCLYYISWILAVSIILQFALKLLQPPAFCYLGERPRGWNWVDVVKHLSQTGKQHQLEVKQQQQQQQQKTSW